MSSRYPDDALVTVKQLPAIAAAIVTQAATATATAIGGLTYATGLYYSAAGVRTAVNRPNGFLTFMPFKIESNQIFTGMAIEVITAGNTGSVARLGVYRDAGGPGALVIDAGTVPTDSIGIKTITALTMNLATGWYYLAVSVQSAATVNAVIRGFAPGQVVPGSPFAYVNNSTLQNAAGWAIANGGQGALPVTAVGAGPADTTFAPALIV